MISVNCARGQHGQCSDRADCDCWCHRPGRSRMAADNEAAGRPYTDFELECGPALMAEADLLAGRDGPRIPLPATVCPTCGESVTSIEDHKLAEECLTLEACVCGRCKGCPDGYHHNPLDWPCICTPDCVLLDDDDQQPVPVPSAALAGDLLGYPRDDGRLDDSDWSTP